MGTGRLVLARDQSPARFWGEVGIDAGCLYQNRLTCRAKARPPRPDNDKARQIDSRIYETDETMELIALL